MWWPIQTRLQGKGAARTNINICVQIISQNLVEAPPSPFIFCIDKRLLQDKRNGRPGHRLTRFERTDGAWHVLFPQNGNALKWFTGGGNSGGVKLFILVDILTNFAFSLSPALPWHPTMYSPRDGVYYNRIC